ncbi:hypothetical protein BV898_02188 [Hypsibius exemplaris]|uniref:Coiled-coil domain-containing protein 137 n=1 Tax=Hypsibius exemplaris TaxID=2072580 RepID=A0A1W0X8W9_HYPEX|nr:hypothetical protein BV898_02188 [Hypsibius exemplaris]
MHRRTQKTSKHKKIKACDPFYSGPRKDHVFKADKNANKAPTGAVGEQEVPRKLRELIKAKDAMKNAPAPARTNGRRAQAKNRNKYAALQQASKAGGPVTEFKQGKYESQLGFFRRMDKTAQEAITKAELEVQFDVNFERQGKRKLIVSKNKDPLAVHKPTKTPMEPEVTRSKSQKRREKLHQKVQDRKAYERDEFAEMHDEVQFGEVVMAPPQMNSAPRKAPKVKAAGDKKLILLTKLHPDVEEAEPEKRSLFADLLPDVNAESIAAARQEVKRQHAVNAYRQMKKKREKHAIPE